MNPMTALKSVRIYKYYKNYSLQKKISQPPPKYELVIGISDPMNSNPPPPIHNMPGNL